MDISSIKVGARCELVLPYSAGGKISKTLVSQIIDIQDDQCLVLSTPIHKSRIQPIPAGARVDVAFLHDVHGLLGFQATIIKRDWLENIAVLHAKIASDIHSVQRRKYFRLNCFLTVNYCSSGSTDSKKPAADKSSGQEYKKAVAKNISGGGACIVVNECIPVDSIIETEFFIHKAFTFRARCKVVRSIKMDSPGGGKYELGLFFQGISKEAQEQLIKYIFQQQRNLLKMAK